MYRGTETLCAVSGPTEGGWSLKDNRIWIIWLWLFIRKRWDSCTLHLFIIFTSNDMLKIGTPGFKWLKGCASLFSKWFPQLSNKQMGWSRVQLPASQVIALETQLCVKLAGHILLQEQFWPGEPSLWWEANWTQSDPLLDPEHSAASALQCLQHSSSAMLAKGETY